MSTTWATCISTGDRSRLRFYAKIQGIPYVFQTASTDLPTSIESGTLTRFKGMLTPTQEGPRLDIARRRMIGGSLELELLEDASDTLAALFAPRVRETTFIAADATASATTLTVDSTSGLASSGTVYVGGETITYTGTTATTLTGCTRGAFSSRAQVRRGSSSDGEGVYESPPWWFGRRVYLYGYFEDENGNTTSNLTSQLGTFSIEENPKFDSRRGAWVINCGDLIDEFSTKKLGRGLRPAPLTTPAAIGFDSTGTVLELALSGDALDRFVEGGADATTYALLTMQRNGGFQMYRLEDVAASAIQLYPGNRINDRHPSYGTGAQVTQVQHVAVIEGSPIQVILRAATSILGDSTNGSSDIYPGRERDDFAEESWFFGAGIDAGDIDTTTITEANGVGSIAWPIFAEHDFATLMEECCRKIGMFWYVTRAGKISVKRLVSDGATSLTLGDSIIIPGSAAIEYDEEGVHPSIELEGQYNPVDDSYDVKIVVNDIEMRERYANRSEPLKLQRRAIETLMGEGKWGSLVTGREVNRDTLAGELRDEQVADGRGRAIVTVGCNIAAIDVEIGDVVSLTVDLPDLEGSSTISSRRALCVGREPRYADGVIELRLMLLESRVHRIAPAAVIQSVAGNTLTLRANSTTYPEASGADPGDMFPDDSTIQIWDVSAGTFVSRVIDSTTATTVTLTAAPPAITNDEDFITTSTQSNTEGKESNNGYTRWDFLYQMSGVAASPPAAVDAPDDGRTRLV